MSWLDEVINHGPYYAQGKFCDEYLDIYNKYELVIIEENDYKRLIEARDRALVDTRINIAKGTEDAARYQYLENYFKTEIRAFIIALEQQEIICNTVGMYKEKLAKVLRNNPKHCRENGIPVPNAGVVYTFESYQRIAERIKLVKAKVDAFMTETKKKK